MLLCVCVCVCVCSWTQHSEKSYMHKTDPWLPIAQACMAPHQIHTLRDRETMEDFPPSLPYLFPLYRETQTQSFLHKSFVNISLITHKSLLFLHFLTSLQTGPPHPALRRGTKTGKARLRLLLLIPDSNDDVSMLLTIFPPNTLSRR